MELIEAIKLARKLHAGSGHTFIVWLMPDGTYDVRTAGMPPCNGISQAKVIGG